MVQLIRAFSVLEMKTVYLLVNVVKELNVGKELQQEELPLQMGSRLYQIPASFSIELKQDKSDLEFNMKRRLLNTEKLIFKVDSDALVIIQEPGREEVYVLVTVEPAGVVALPHVQERQTVIFNIGKKQAFVHVCDELSLGIPHKAWWVGMLAFLCIGMALIIPYFLPSLLRPRRTEYCYEPGLSKGA
ncbi:hypothetical protein ACLOJK_013052 [Asimina triloba]